MSGIGDAGKPSSPFATGASRTGTGKEALANEIRRLADFIRHLDRFANSTETVNVYRGHADFGYKLTPTLLRTKDWNYRNEEKNIFRDLICLHPEEFRDDKSVFEQLVRMQHFSLPTRLLDATYNPLVALYFACEVKLGDGMAGLNLGKKKEKIHTGGEVVRLSIPRSRLKYFDSDTVSCIANLSSLSGDERNALRTMEDRTVLNESREGRRLIQFIKGEKPYFLPEIVPADLKSVFLVKPKLNNRRILAQQGAFFIFGLLTELEENNEFGITIERIPIPAVAKTCIRNDLDKVNMNDSSLFAEMDRSARYLASKLPSIGGTPDQTG